MELNPEETENWIYVRKSGEKGERQQSPLFASCGHSGGRLGGQGLTIGPEHNFFHLNGGQEQLQAGDHKTGYNAQFEPSESTQNRNSYFDTNVNSANTAE